MNTQVLTLDIDRRLYVASDFHLGVPNPQASRDRENRIVAWLKQIHSDAQYLFVLGDLFDFWFEYKDVVPKGYIRFLGALADLKARGVDVRIFSGNHDMWMFDYFETELQIPVYKTTQRFVINDQVMIIGHGDGLGPGDQGYKLIKRIFASRLNQRLFAAIHPRWAFAMARFFSKTSRAATSADQEQFLGPDQEFQIQYALQCLENDNVAYFVFGHRHLAMTYALSDQSLYVNTGHWLGADSYWYLDGLGQNKLIVIPQPH